MLFTRIPDLNFYISDPESWVKEIPDPESGIWIYTKEYKYFYSVADPDPGSGIGYLFDPWIRDPGWEKVSIRIRDPG